MGLVTNKPVALRFLIELESRSVGFCGQWEENRRTQEKTLRERIATNKLNPHMMAVQESNPDHIGVKRALIPAPDEAPCLSFLRQIKTSGLVCLLSHA